MHAIIKEILNEPDERILRCGKEITTYLPQFTVPLFIFRHQIDDEHYLGRGSGVLVWLWERYFVISVGHVIQLLSTPECKLLMSIANKSHRFSVIVGRTAAVCDDKTRMDYGYAEITSTDASVIKANA